MTKNNSHHDIIIVGGGMVGLALACALAQQTDLSILIVESQPPFKPWTAEHYHHRVSAIALSSQRIFKSLNVWESIKEKRISPYTQIKVWDAAGKGAIQFDSKEIAEPLLGFIIENNVIQSALDEKRQTCSRIDYVSGVQLSELIENEDSVRLMTADGREFTAKLAVAADGAQSWLREKAGIGVAQQAYGQEAIVATVQTKLPHDAIARQVFLETGPLAFLPLAEPNKSSIVWSVPSDEMQRLMALEEESFKQELAAAFSCHLGDIVHVDQRYAFPLYKQQANHYIKSRVVLVGDAAHTVHPLAGQGVNIGLLDAASLTETIVTALKANRDFSNARTLRQYERWRRADNATMLAGVDAIKRLFASDKRTVQTLRSVGLDAVNHLRWMKNIFTRHAVGDRDGLPSMAKGVGFS